MTVRAFLAFMPPTLLGAMLVWQALGTVPSPPEITPRERQVPVSYVTVASRDFVPRVSGYGTVAPARVWTAVAHVGGPVVYLHPDFARGGFVAEGTVLIRIAADDYAIALERAAADLAAADARLDEARASKATTTALLAIEREALALAEADLARTERLARSGTVSATVVDERRRDVLAQRSKVQTQENTLALLPAQIAAFDASAAAARAAQAAAALDVARTVIRAPFNARVARSDVEIGQYVGAGTVMASLDGAAAAEIDVQVSQDRMTALARLVAAAPTRDNDVGADPVAPATPRGV
ncbi:MAG: HlyD family efflux transporter periplasmic adaptor subunit, partial [Pseudomonadota bacterium]